MDASIDKDDSELTQVSIDKDSGSHSNDLGRREGLASG
jgi:hypothetical protein